MQKRLIWFVTLILILPVLAACGGALARPEAAAGAVEAGLELPAVQTGEKYGLIAGNINDGGYNQLAWEGLQQATTELGVEVNHLNSTPDNAAENIDQLLAEGYNGIISVGFDLAGPTKTASQGNPGTPFVNIDFPSQTVGDLGILFATDEPAFLAGYLAAAMSQTGTVCTYGGLQIPPVLIFMVGFEHGVNYYNEQKGGNVQVLGWETDAGIALGGAGTFSGNFTDAADGERLAKQFFDQGCDIIFPVAGAVGLGSAGAAQQRGLIVIGVDADQAETVPEYAGVYLTSVLKQVDLAVLEAVKSIHEGSFQGGENFIGSLENSGVGLAPFHSFEGQVSQQLRNELAQIEQGLIAGSISTGWPIIGSAAGDRRLGVAVLQNSSYPSEWTASGTVTLAGGEYREPAAPGSAAETVVQLSDQIAFGDLDGDGFDDAAVVLITNSGGSGTFFDLVAVLDRQGKPDSVATIPLGDRIQLNGLNIQGRQIVVDMITHGPDDPMCCPTQQATKSYELQFSLAEQ